MTAYHTLFDRTDKKDGKKYQHREYSVELGLRTHRPSAITSSFEPFTYTQTCDSDGTHLEAQFVRRNNPRNESLHRDTLSQCSNKPQLGDVNHWWELPPCSSNGSYQQRTKNVRISYSSEEIYGKANISQNKKDETSKRLANSKHDRFASENYANTSSSPTLTQDVEPVINEKSTKFRGDRDSSSSRNRLSKETSLLHSKHVTKQFIYQQDLSYDNCHSTIKYRTFEEAMNSYPSDESEDSDSSPDWKSYSNFQTLRYSKNVFNNGGICFDTTNASGTQSSSDREKQPKAPAGFDNSDALLRCELSAKSDITKPSIHTHKEAWLSDIEEKVSSEASFAQGSAQDVTKTDSFSNYPNLDSPDHMNAPILQLKETPADKNYLMVQQGTVDERQKLESRNFSAQMSDYVSTEPLKACITKAGDHPSQLTQYDRPALNDVTVYQGVCATISGCLQKNDGVPSELCSDTSLHTCSTQDKNEVQNQDKLEESTHLGLVKPVFPNVDSITLPAPIDKPEVPPIDLSQLSPKKTKSAKLPRRSVSKSNTFKSKTSSQAQTDFHKAQPTSSITPKAGDFKNRKQIAREIKLRVQKNPTEIAGEIKRRVQKKEREEPKPEVSTSCDYLKVDQQPLTTRSILALSSFRAYDRYNEMSPRIQSGDVSRWQCLPEEIWLLILSFLPCADLHSFMLTCSDFNRLSHDHSLWREVTLCRKQLSDEEIIKLGFLHPSSLSIVQCTGIKLNGNTVSNRGLRELFHACSQDLKQLSVASCVMPPLSGEAMLHHAAIHCSNVQTLDISWCNLTNRDIELVVNSFTGLRCLSCNGNQSITDVAVNKLCVNLGSQLEKLELQGCFKLTNQSLQVIGSCINLQTLNIGQCHKFSSSRISTEVSRLVNLESCNLKGLKQVKDTSIAAIAKSCPRLRQFVLAQCTALSPKSLIEISCSLPSLSTLDVSSCKDCVNDASINAMLANCSLLISLDVSSTPITNQSVAAIAATCKCIQELKLNFCSITESIVKELLLQSKSISKLSLYGVKNIQLDELSDINSAVEVEH
ncbi:uncharacterized protein [Watersipora subatra]|uniref:uncharacterized protein n=1 Tax=Watersipora subatra TaxID=2589382 RepID=UPI00355B2499